MTATSPAVTIVADGRVDERETKTPAETRDAQESASSDDDGGDAESESKSESESEFEDEDVDAVRATLDRQGLGDDDDDDVVADDVDERDTRVRLLLIRERDAEFAADRSFKSRSLTDLNNEAVRHLKSGDGASCRTPNCLEKLPRTTSRIRPCSFVTPIAPSPT